MHGGYRSGPATLDVVRSTRRELSRYEPWLTSGIVVVVLGLRGVFSESSLGGFPFLSVIFFD